MHEFKLDPTLANDCILIGELDISLLLLNKNALVPWLILVPKYTHPSYVTEFTDLNETEQARVLSEINLVSMFLKKQHPACKLNIATIGNVVSQCHIHVVARHEQDFCWPDVVWGQSQREDYSDETLEVLIQTIKTDLQTHLK